MDIFAKKLLLLSELKQYTLTVVTNPSGATCTLTANGVSQNTKTLTVDRGTVVSYSIYDSTYGTTTGTVTMNSDKTLSCTGTYTTSETETSWSRPNLSSNGTVGSSNYATSSGAIYGSNYAYYAVDGSSTTYWYGRDSVPYSWLFYTNTPIKITQMTLNARASGSSGYYQAQAFSIQGSVDGSSYTTLFSHSDNSRPATVTANLSPADYYNYYRVYITTAAVGTGAAASTQYTEISMVGTQKVTSYTYYWNVTVV